MVGVEALSPSSLRRTCDPRSFSFETTAELQPLDGAIGQARALEALEFGMGMRRAGYNLFVLGAPGTGRHTLVRRYLDDRAAAEPVPPDWVYVHDFAEPRKPRSIRLEAGRGAQFRQDMDALVEELRAALPAAFEGDDYRARKDAINQEFKELQEQSFGELAERAGPQGVMLIHTPSGVALAPSKDGEVLSAEEFEQLPEERRKQLAETLGVLQHELMAIVRRLPAMEKARRGKLHELDREVTRFAVGHLMDELRKRYHDVPAVLEHLEAVQHDVLENAAQFLQREQPGIEMLLERPLPMPRADVHRYGVNVVVDHGKTRGAPVVVAEHPTLPALLGSVEHVSHLGTLVTDHTLIRPGALHRALGGYLLLDARRVLQQPYAWEGLQRALRSRELRIESVAEQLGLLSTASLEPEPIPVDVKVVLVGDPRLYYLLTALDPDFGELFKVPVDFDDRVDWDAAATETTGRMVATIARDERLRPFDRGGVARVVEQLARNAGDARKLSTRLDELVDLLRESDDVVARAGGERVGADDVERAVEARVHRADRLRERVQEEIRRGTFRIETRGGRVGQVNGLSVIDLGGFAFGRPTRISARVRVGKGDVVDIEREVELGGPTHSKGVLILSGFLGGRYAAEHPLALSASLVFEQSYGAVEGDSASLAELCALLSALAEVPVRQALAVTGSIDQHGRVQAIGGVNEKIEGFFDTCCAAGLSGEQGVIIPATNVEHLMLRRDVVAAAAEGRFAVYPVATVDQALELLTGMEAGERGSDWRFPSGSLNGRVEDRLELLAERERAYSLGRRELS